MLRKRRTSFDISLRTGCPISTKAHLARSDMTSCLCALNHALADPARRIISRSNRTFLSEFFTRTGDAQIFEL